MRGRLFAWLLLLSVVTPTWAQDPSADAAVATEATAPDIVDLDVVVVSGAQPGPGMWKVSKGDHVLWILGTLSPLPKRMEWISTDVEKTIAQSQEVIASPTVKLDSDIGVFRSMMLLPSLLRARRNPDGKRLQDVVPAGLYARWQVLKARYIGSDRGIEQWRPVFAAQELYEAAMRKSGLTQDSVVQPVVKKAARRHEVRVVPSEVTIDIKNPKAALKEFSDAALADTDCFAKTMSRIETDLDAMRARANAWAVGDLDALRALPDNDQYIACTRAFTETGLAQKLGISDIRTRVANTWLATAEAAIAKNASTFATLPISQLLKPDGYLARLQAKGYAVEAP